MAEIKVSGELGRYAAYTSSSLTGEFKLNRRIIPSNFRRQAKGIGAGGFNVYSKNGLTSFEEDTIKDPVAGDYIAVVDLKLGLTGANGEDYKVIQSPKNILFLGRIRQVTLDVFKNNVDKRGYISADEIGYEFSKQPLNLKGEDYPPFNPYLDGTKPGFYANKSNSIEGFTNKGKFHESGDIWAPENRSNVWKLSDAIEFAAHKESLIVSFPWQRGEGAEEDYGVLTDNKTLTSYPSLNGHSLVSWLDTVIEDPFSYYFDYNSSFQLTLVIYSKSPISIPEVSPAAKKVTLLVDSNTTNVNVVDVDEAYDEITLEGDNILFAGSVSPCPTYNVNTIEPGWTGWEEIQYIAGGEADGTTLPTQISDNQAATNRKNKFERVYQYYTWQSADTAENPYTLPIDCVPSNPYKDPAKYTFFPKVYFTGNVYEIPTSTTPQIDKSISMTPNKGSLKYGDFIPYYEVEEIKDNSSNTVTSLGKKNKKTYPTAFFPYLEDDEVKWTDATTINGNKDACELTFDVNGLWLRSSIPESFAVATSDYDPLFYVDRDNVVHDKPTDLWSYSTPKATSPRDPSTDISYAYLSNYSRLVFTISMYSNQKLSHTIKRKVPVKNPSTGAVELKFVDGSRRKIISNPELQLHVLHPRVVVGVDNYGELIQKSMESTNLQTHQPIYEHLVTRNDFPKLIQQLKSYTSWFFAERKSLKLDWAAMNISGFHKIGTMVGEVKDGTGTITANSTIESIEWDLNDTSPRYIVSTQIPEIPIIKRAETVRISPSAPQPVKDLQAPIVSSKATSPIVSAQPVIESVRGGGGGSQNAAYNIYKVIGGNVLPLTGTSGVRKVIETIEEPIALPGDILLMQPIETLGIGYGESIEDGKIVYLLNDNRSGIPHDLLNKHMVICQKGTLNLSTTTSADVSGGADISGSYGFYIPIAAF